MLTHAVQPRGLEHLEPRTHLSASVVGRYVTYNQSAWDHWSIVPEVWDDLAIAPDKTALLPGQTATFANYISAPVGLTGIMVDIAGLPGTPTASDFSFRYGNNNAPDGWTAAPTPDQVFVRSGAGVNGSTRIELTWADDAIKNQWLQIEVLPTANTGLTTPDVFYFGSAIGETGNSRTNARVNTGDALAVRANLRDWQNPATIDDPYDFNHDQRVDTTDELIASTHQTNFKTQLNLISPMEGMPASFSMPSITSTIGGFSLRDAQALPTPWSSTTTKDLTGAVNYTFSLSGQSQNDDGSITETWSTPGGEITATAVLHSDGDTRDAQLTVTNNSAVRLHQLDVDMPFILSPATTNHKILTGYRGGTFSPWPTSGHTVGNGSQWPNMGYSPVSIFYDKATTEGIGMTAFNDKLIRTTLSWETDPSLVAPHARFLPELATGASATFHLQLRHQDIGMPDAHLYYYRNNFLAPFMASQGIPEAQYHVSGPGVYWGYTNGWSLPDGTLGPTPAGLLSVAKTQQALGARGFIEWGQPDAGSSATLPYTPNIPWATGLNMISKLGMSATGVLVNPFITGPNPAPANWFDTGWAQNLSDPGVQAYLANYKKGLVSRGVTFAFWDTGADPRNGDGLAWLHLMADWKQSGITIAPESTCDVAVWATGANVNYPYTWQDLIVAREVTPNATQFAFQPLDETRTVSGASVYWWQDAMRQGVVPILNLPQLQKAAALAQLAALGAGGTHRVPGL